MTNADEMSKLSMFGKTLHDFDKVFFAFERLH